MGVHTAARMRRMKTAHCIAALLLGISTAAALAQTPAAPATTPSPPAQVPAPAPPPAPAPAATAAGDGMEGLAAVYSDRLDGRKTASGQVFSQKKLTAAHPSLAFGTKVRVTNTKNAKTVEVTINDRGPMQAGRVIDLSSAAAAKIGLGKKGLAPVRLEVVAAPSAGKAP